MHKPDLAFAVSVLGKGISKELDFMLTYNCVDKLEFVAFSYYLAGCVDDIKSTNGYIFLLANGAIRGGQTVQYRGKV